VTDTKSIALPAHLLCVFASW